MDFYAGVRNLEEGPSPLELGTPLLMIDTEGTRDRDDAFTVHVLPSGGWRFEVHIAAVADVVPVGSVVDRRAFERITTRYKPNRTFPMLGADAEQAATLTTAEDRPSLCIAGTITQLGLVEDVDLSRSVVRAGRCAEVSYREVASILTDPTTPLHETLCAANDAAQALLAARRANDAFVYYDLVGGLVATEEGTLVRLAEELRTNAYVIVQEMMIAANEAVASWSIRQGLPILYRNHRANPVIGDGGELVAELEAARGDVQMTERIRRRLVTGLRPATYDATVHGHHGLRVAAYTHATSPLRRVADLITQRIVFAALDDSAYPYTPEQVAALGADLNRRIQQAREEKSAFFKDADQRETARAAGGDLSMLDTKRFRKLIKCAATGPLEARLDAELRRRLAADILDAADVAAVLMAADRTWQPLQTDLCSRWSAEHRDGAPSVLSMWCQQQPEVSPAEIDWEQRGPSHAPLFAVRVRFNEVVGPWVVGSVKKTTEQEAMWAMLDARSRGIERHDDEIPWPASSPEAAQKPAKVTTTPPVILHSAPPAPQIEPAMPASNTKLVKALKNPVAWVTSFAQTRGLVAPRWDVEQAGPSHAPTFTVKVECAGLRASAVENSKSAARTAAAANLVHEIFSAAVV